MTASVVVIDNRNAAIKAMVGGPDFETKPFNLATQGHRQPGSSIKPFTLLTALEEGISPETVYESAPQEFHFGKHGRETFVVHNDEDSYLGSCSIICATTYSDNSIYAQLGLEGLEGKTVEDRTRSIASTIHRAGYSDPVSTNPAMVLGGLREGVTPLGWAYAYTTIGNNGDRVSGTLAPRPGDSPVSYTQVTDRDGHTIKGGDNDSTHDQIFDQGNAEEEKSILETVVSSGTGTHAQIGAEGQWGKTGTTENNGDAWFCGGVGDEVTACVWVGYADSTTPMTTLYNGGPVMGGTFPALIWASVISAWEEIKAGRAAEKGERPRRIERRGRIHAPRSLDRSASRRIGSRTERTGSRARRRSDAGSRTGPPPRRAARVASALPRAEATPSRRSGLSADHQPAHRAGFGLVCEFLLPGVGAVVCRRPRVGAVFEHARVVFDVFDPGHPDFSRGFGFNARAFVVVQNFLLPELFVHCDRASGQCEFDLFSRRTDDV